MCLCALCLMTSLTACKSEETFNWSQLSSVTPTATPAPSAESAVLDVFMPTASGDFDPYTNPSQSMQGLMKLCYESVVRLDDRYQPQNWLAESIRKIEDGYEITLRSGVLFHDGKGLTAADVEAAFDAISAAEESPWKDTVAPLKSVQADGERTVIVKTDAGYQALYALTFPIVNKDSEGSWAAGTGPYQVTAYAEGASMDFVRWDGWWRTPAQIPAIHAIAREDAEAMLNTFVTGSLDVCAVDMLTVSSVKQRSYVKKQEYLTGQAELLLPNLGGTLGDARLRRVVALALDKKDVVANTYQNHGVAVDVPVLPDSWLAERTSDVEHDAQQAADILRQLGWEDLDGDGFVERRMTHPETAQPDDADEQEQSLEDALQDADNSEVLGGLLGMDTDDAQQSATETLHLTILTNEEDSSLHKDAAGRIAQQLNAAGIETSIEAVPFRKLQSAVEEGDWDLLLVGYQLPDTGDLSSLLSTGGENNRMGYSSAAMDAALQAVEAAQTQETYYAAMQQVYDLILQDMPLYTVCMRTRTQVAAETVSVSGIIRPGEPYRGIEYWTNMEP